MAMPGNSAVTAGRVSSMVRRMKASRERAVRHSGSMAWPMQAVGTTVPGQRRAAEAMARSILSSVSVSRP